MNFILAALIPLFILFIAIIIVGSIIIRIIRALAGGGGLAVNRYANVVSSLSEDGFWIADASIEPMSNVYYHYWVNGNRRGGQITFQPDPAGRQFVYTGSRPERVVIHRVAGPAQLVDDSTTIIEAGSSGWMAGSFGGSSGGGSSGFPSAY